MFINTMLVTFTSMGGYDFAVKSVMVKASKEIDPVNITNDMK